MRLCANARAQREEIVLMRVDDNCAKVCGSGTPRANAWTVSRCEGIGEAALMRDHVQSVVFYIIY